MRIRSNSSTHLKRHKKLFKKNYFQICIFYCCQFRERNNGCKCAIIRMLSTTTNKNQFLFLDSITNQNNSNPRSVIVAIISLISLGTPPDINIFNVCYYFQIIKSNALQLTVSCNDISEWSRKGRNCRFRHFCERNLQINETNYCK